MQIMEIFAAILNAYHQEKALRQQLEFVVETFERELKKRIEEIIALRIRAGDSE